MNAFLGKLSNSSAVNADLSDLRSLRGLYKTCLKAGLSFWFPTLANVFEQLVIELVDTIDIRLLLLFQVLELGICNHHVEHVFMKSDVVCNSE